MFVIFLEFSSNKADAKAHMAGHVNWLKAGFDDGVFLASGGLEPGRGGAILAAGGGAAAAKALRARLARDPFVEHEVVRAEIHEISLTKSDSRLDFLRIEAEK